MADTLAWMAEAHKRGILPDDKKLLYEEAVKRGLVKTSEPNINPESSPAISSPDIKSPQGFAQFLEPLATIGSGMLAEPIAGVAGIAQSLNPFASEGAGNKAVESTREALTYQPKSDFAQQTVGEIGKTIEPVAELAKKVSTGLGDVTFNLTGSPTAATIAATAPDAIAAYFGLKGLKSVRTGARLMDEAGQPTLALRKALDKKGLDFNSLDHEVKSLIPQIADTSNIPGANTIGPEVENVIRGQLKVGAKDDALAGVKLVGNKVVPDRAGLDAIKQGFRPGFVQSVKTASAATKQKMLKMSRMMRSIQKNEREGLNYRPSDVVGDSVAERLNFIRDKADRARNELNDIAKTKLRGVEIDSNGVVDSLQSALDDLDITLKESSTGKLKPDYNGSLISKDRSSQRVINDLVDLMHEGGKPDALRFHKMKRMLDIMIDYNKKRPGGLTDAGRNVLKNVRASLNESLRPLNPDYARVNDVLSSSIGAMEDFDKATGSIDIFGEGSAKAVGQKMRTLLSNQQGRVKLENSLSQIEDVANKLGGNFSDNIKDLVMFADGLDNRFGTTAKTSFAGQIGQATERVMTNSPKQSAINAVAGAAGKGVEKIRGITDFNAYEAMESLLKEQVKKQ